MSTTLYDGIVERTPEGGWIRFERHLTYSIEDVWDAVTSPERLADWWLPFDANITVDLQEGGVMRFVGKDDPSFAIECTILRIDAPRLLEHTHVDEGSYMRWELEPVDTGCVLRLSHFTTDPGLAIERCFVVGLHTSLSRLEPALAGKAIPWDDDEFLVTQAAYAEAGFAPAVA